jgi:anti-sigma regulatory factor (Ser/Thr protein kinase)
MAEQPDAAGPADISIESNNPAEAKSLFITHFRTVARQRGWSALVSNEFELIVEEWLTNVIGYALDKVLDPFISLDLRVAHNEAVIQIADSGVPFDPLSRPDPDLTIAPEDRPIGGLGIFMVKKLSTEVNYERRNGRNVVTIRKNILTPALSQGEKWTGVI